MADAPGSAATVKGAVERTKRRFARADVALDATYELADRTGRAPATIHNLGGGGLRLAGPEDLPREAALTVHFRLPEGGRDLMVRGKSVLSFYDAGKATYLHGVAFTQIARGDQEAIVAYVESLAHHESSDRPA